MQVRTIAQNSLGFVAVQIVRVTEDRPAMSSDILSEFKVFDEEAPDIIVALLQRLAGQGKITEKLEVLMRELIGERA